MLLCFVDIMPNSFSTYICMGLLYYKKNKANALQASPEHAGIPACTLC